MRRLICTVLVGALLLIPTHAAFALDYDRCRFQDLEPHKTWSTWETQLTVQCFARKLLNGAEQRFASYVAYRESRFHHRAWNDSSNAAGVYQHLIQYWPGRVRASRRLLKRWDVKRLKWYNPRAQAVVSMGMVRRSNVGWCVAWC